MKHFISFQKVKGLYLTPEQFSNEKSAYRIQSELLKYGFVLDQLLFDVLKTQSNETLTDVYNDLCRGLQELFGGDGYEPIYRNFPQSVLNMEYEEFVINAICHYWSGGTWRPEDEGYLNREFAIEPVNFKSVKLISQDRFNSIFTDLLYSGDSLSEWDKRVIDWFIDNTSVMVDFGKISFNETKAHIGKRYLETRLALPTKSATTVLRIFAAYCNGDEGLKENTKFKQPSRKVKRCLMRTLNGCYDLEESFKLNREPWLRVLFYLNPGSDQNKKSYPALAEFANKIRNTPKTLRTFNSYFEQYVSDKNPAVFDLLKTRKGMYMRSINRLFGVFGMTAIDKFIGLNPTFDQMITVYNYFSDRDQVKDRAVVLASKAKSDVTTFDALEALSTSTVVKIQSKLMDAIKNKVTKTQKKVFIDRTLYYSPLATNNRASSFSIESNATGKVEKLPKGKTIRCYVHWIGESDIDLSGFVITSENTIKKVGWNSAHKYQNAIVYSGDNTGYSSKNAEYLDIATNKLSDVEWVIVDAKVYRGTTYKKWQGSGVHAGWMQRDKPEANNYWLPETVTNAIKLSSDSKSAYLMAIHVPTNNLVYLDVAQSQENIVTTAADVARMRSFLEKAVMLDDGSDQINWKKLAQGHVLNLLSDQIVSTKDEAEIVFDENTPREVVSRIITEEYLID